MTSALWRSAWAFVFVVATAPVAAADWVRVETPNFIVYGEPGERRVREVADEFERFREALARVIPAAATPAAVPTVVVVFGSQRAFEPYLPRFNGKPMRLGGYFFSSDDMNIVALADKSPDESLRTIFHEYVHLVLDNMSRGLPLWLNEGLAEYYSTFEVADGGRRALIGKTIASHLQLLNSRKLLTIPELLAVEHDSPDYNEGARQSLFYAQSWALVHMLVAGSPNRAPLLAEYGRLVADGMPSLEAWQQVFKAQNIGGELERYVGQDVMTGVLYRFSERINTTKSAAARVSDADVQAVLGDLLRRVAPPEEAAAQFERAIGMQPPSARARALYGLLLVDASNTTKARPLFLDAARDTSDWLVQYHVATGLTRLITTGSDSDAALIPAARAALARVRATHPDLANVHALDARLETAEDDDPALALEAITRARAIAPGRVDYMLLESFIHLRLGQFVAARAIVTPLTGPSASSDVRSNARDILAQIDRLEQEAAEYVTRLEGRSVESGIAKSSGRVSALRRLQPDERRVEGLLERIDCNAKGIVFEVNVGGAAEWFAAASLRGVTLISHRDDLRGAIGCGPRITPDRVYVTWKPADSPDGARRVVAVEFLPKQ